MTNIGVFWDKKDRVHDRDNRSYVIYFDGNKRVISFKFPEQLTYEVDKYVSIMGLKNRSDLLRLLLIVFLENMRQIEKMGLFDKLRGNIKIGLSIEIGSKTITKTTSILDFVAGSSKLVNIVEPNSHYKHGSRGKKN